MKVLLAGEGKTELGDFDLDPAYRATPPADGVVLALAEALVPAGWQVGHAVKWSRIRKFRAGDHASPEARNVLALALDCVERDLPAVVFARDVDGQRDRAADIDDGVRRARERFPKVGLAGGLPSQAIENWLLALRGEVGTETLHRDQARRRVETEAPGVADKVAWVRASDAERVATDAKSLRDWVEALSLILVATVGSD